MAQYIRWMQEADAEPLGDAGEEIRVLHLLQQEEFPVPPGFVLEPAAYEQCARELDLAAKGRAAVEHPGALSEEQLESGLESFRTLIEEAETGPDLQETLQAAWMKLAAASGPEPALAAVVCPILLPELPAAFPSAPAGGLPIEVRDPAQLLPAVRRAWARAWSGACFRRCIDAGADPFSVRVALWVRRRIDARVGGAFVYRKGTETGKPEMLIDACWGMAEAVFSEGFEVDRFVLQDAPLVLLEQNVGSKERKLVPHPDGLPRLHEEAVPEEMAEMPCLGWEQIQEIAETGRAVRKVTGQVREMHWAYENGDLWVLQVPPVPEAVPGRAEAGKPPEGPEEGEGDARARYGEGALPAAPGESEIVSGGSGEAGGPPERDPAPGDAGSPSPGDEVAAPEAGGGGEKGAAWWEDRASRASELRFPGERYPGWRLSLAQRARAELLAALFRSVRKRKGQGGPVRERDEFSHRHTASRYWNESYYFNFFDPGLKVGGFSRIGMVPNQDMAIGILYLFLPDGGILMLTQTEPCRLSRDKVSAGLLGYERVHPLWSWRIRFEGSMLYLEDPAQLPSLLVASPEEMARRELSFPQVSLDLLFRGWSPCHDFKGADPRFVAERFVAAGSRVRDLQAVSQVASEHYEQVGGWHGEVVVDGRRMELSGSGHRDHSWGDRDWKAPSKWTWLTAQFGDAFGFNLSRVVIRSLDLFNGYVCRAGKNVPLRRAWLDTEFEEDGLTQKRVLLRIQDAEGWEAQIEGRPRTVVPLILQEGEHRTLVNEAFTVYRCEGRTGCGISEYLHQLG